MSQYNAVLWDNYEAFARQRGQMVIAMLEPHVELRGAKILDFGCGTGGISLQLAAAGAKVTAVDSNPEKCDKLKRASHSMGLPVQVLRTAPKAGPFDAIILLDVIEHLIDPEAVLRQLHFLLRPGGWLYLSTPSRFAAANLFCDPHFSLPFVALMKRDAVKKIAAEWLAWQPRSRIDFPQLFSLRQLDERLNSAGFQWQFINEEVTRYAFAHPQAVWNRPAHLRLVAMAKRIGLQKLVGKLPLNGVNFFNTWLNPTWFILARKS